MVVIHAKIADGVNVTNKIILNNLICGDQDILHKSNLGDVLNLVHEINKQYNMSQYIVDRIKYKHNILYENTDKTHLYCRIKQYGYIQDINWKNCLMA